MAKTPSLTAQGRQVAVSTSTSSIVLRMQQWWRGTHDDLSAYLFLAPFLFFYIVFMIWPLIQGIWISLHSWTLIGTDVKFVGLDNYKRLLGDGVFWSSLWHTVFFVVLAVPPLVVLALTMALLINRPYRIMGLFRALLYLPSVLSVAVVTTIWLRMYEPNFGLFANWFKDLGLTPVAWLQSVTWAMPAVAFATVWWTVGGNMLLFLAGLQDIPPELYEAAKLDGANGWTLFRHITIPALRRTFTIVTVTTVIGSLQVFGQIYTLTRGGPIGTTRTTVMYIYETSFRDFQLGYGSAMAYMLFLLIFIISIVQFRLFARAEAQTER